MERGAWTFIIVAGIMLLALWAFSGLHAHRAVTGSYQVRTAMEEYDRDLGVIDSLRALRTSKHPHAPAPTQSGAQGRRSASPRIETSGPESTPGVSTATDSAKAVRETAMAAP
jgi:hypothetical protein